MKNKKDFISPLTEINFINERLDKHLSVKESENLKYKYILLENIVPQNYQPDNDELMFFCEVPKQLIDNINIQVLLDENEMYKRDGHPLWLYVQNGKNSNEYIALTIENEPKIANGIKNINLTNSEIGAIYNFILYNKSIIKNIADKKIRSYKIFRELLSQDLQMAESKTAINEMAVIGKEDTGLPVDIWLEFTRTPKNHSLYRFKFQAEQGEKNSRNWPTVIFGNTTVEVLNMTKKTFLKGKDINMLLSFAEKYKEELKSLCIGEMTIDDFIDLINNNKILD